MLALPERRGGLATREIMLLPKPYLDGLPMAMTILMVASCTPSKLVV